MHNKIETELEINIRYIESRFEGCADAVMRRILVGDEKLGMYVVYMDSMYDRDFIDGVVLKSLLFDRVQLPDQNAGQVIFNKYLATADVKETNRMEMLIDEVLKGNTAILIDGMAKAMIVSSKNLPGRGVSEAETEVSVRGSKESFTESFRVNTVADPEADQRYTAEEPADDHRRPFKNRCGVDVYGGSGTAGNA